MTTPLSDKGEVGDCVCGDEYDEGATNFYTEEDVSESINAFLKDLKNESNELREFNFHDEAVIDRFIDLIKLKSKEHFGTIVSEDLK